MVGFFRILSINRRRVNPLPIGVRILIIIGFYKRIPTTAWWILRLDIRFDDDLNRTAHRFFSIEKKLRSALQPITVSWAEEWKNLINRLHDLSCLIEICDVIERLYGSVVAIASSFDARSPSAMCSWWLNWNIIVVVTICLSIDLDSIIWFWFVIGGSSGLCVLWAVFNEARKWLVWLL